jgi:rare lipoprotein A (peptidoglycan hydrolase)
LNGPKAKIVEASTSWQMIAAETQSRCFESEARRAGAGGNRHAGAGRQLSANVDGRIAWPPADDQEASVYWEDTWDARGKRFKPREISCAHRTEAFGTIFVVTNLANGKKINCPVQDRGPFTRGRVLDFSLGAAREIGCDGLCRVTVRRAGYE